MTAAEAVRVTRPRGELDPKVLRRIQRLQREALDAQVALERAVAEELADGAPLNELQRQTGISKTTLLRYARKQ